MKLFFFLRLFAICFVLNAGLANAQLDGFKFSLPNKDNWWFQGVSYSSDAKFLLAYDFDKIYLWEAASGRLLYILNTTKEAGQLSEVAFDDSVRCIVAKSWDFILLYEIKTGRLVRSTQNNYFHFCRSNFQLGSKFLVSDSVIGNYLVDYRTGEKGKFFLHPDLKIGKWMNGTFDDSKKHLYIWSGNKLFEWNVLGEDSFLFDRKREFSDHIQSVFPVAGQKAIIDFFSSADVTVYDFASENMINLHRHSGTEFVFSKERQDKSGRFILDDRDDKLIVYDATAPNKPVKVLDSLQKRDYIAAQFTNGNGYLVVLFRYGLTVWKFPELIPVSNIMLLNCHDFCFSPLQDEIVVSCGEQIGVLKFPSLQPVRVLRGGLHRYKHCYITADERHLVWVHAIDNRSEERVFDFFDFKEVFDGGENTFSSDGRFMCSAMIEDLIEKKCTLFDLKDNRIVRIFDKTDICYPSRNAEYIFGWVEDYEHDGKDQGLFLYSRENDKPLDFLPQCQLEEFNDKGTLALIRKKDSVKVYALQKRRFVEINELLDAADKSFVAAYTERTKVEKNMTPVKTGEVTFGCYLGVDKAVYFRADSLFIFNRNTGLQLYNTSFGGNAISNVFSSKAGNLLAVNLKNSQVILWSHRYKKKIATFLSMESGYLAVTDSNYYTCPKDVANQLYYIRGLETLGFDQLDVKFNRPDKVLEALGSTNVNLIRSYRSAYFKRIKRLGVDTLTFRRGYTVPESEIVDKDKILYTQVDAKLTLHIRGEDKATKLDRYNVWVNGSPVLGVKGGDIRNKKSYRLDTTVTITLSKGKNVIQVSVSNTNATESYRKPFYVEYAPPGPDSGLVYFVGIGVDHFKSDTHPLLWCVKDIRDEVEALRRKFGRRLVVLDTLFNERVTTSNVIALKKLLKQAEVDDRVIIAYSGHGLFGADFDYYLSTYDVNFQNPKEGGLPYEALEDLFDSIPPRKKLLLLDACHSGEVDKEELVRINSRISALTKKNVNGRTKGLSIELVNNAAPKLGAKSGFELMQSLFVNVCKNTGAVVISAAGGTQFAYEKGELRNGVFTYCVLEELKKDHLLVSDLRRNITASVSALTEGLQVPTVRSEVLDSDWEVW